MLEAMANRLRRVPRALIGLGYWAVLPAMAALPALAFAQGEKKDRSGGAGSSVDSPVAAEQSSSRPVWVFFRDKGVSSSQRLGPAHRRMAHLSSRALQRRAKVRPSPAIVDARDLAVVSNYRLAVKKITGEIRTESRWLNAVSTLASPAQIEALKNLKFVDRVEVVAVLQRGPSRGVTPETAPAAGTDKEAEASQSPGGPSRQTDDRQTEYSKFDYGNSKAQLERVGIPRAHECGLTGKGVRIGVLDSGFRVSHSGLRKVKVIDAYDFVDKDKEVANEPGDPSGQDSHGTSCLSLIAANEPGKYVGAAPDVEVLLAKTEDGRGESKVEEDYYVAGLEWIESNGADIATSSLGYTDWYTAKDYNGKTSKASRAVDMAVENGLICLTAAGNSGPRSKTLSVPGDSFKVLTVGATSVSGSLASFSSRGPTADGRMKPEFVAPGQNVWVASVGGGYRKGSGTSFATPIAAGGVALLVQAYPKHTPKQIRELIEKSIRSKGKADSNHGWGEMDVAKALEDFCDCVDKDGDGFKDAECGGKDCDDSNPKIHPDAKEDCEDGVDNDCDGKIDAEDSDCKEDPGAGDNSGSGSKGEKGGSSSDSSDSAESSKSESDVDSSSEEGNGDEDEDEDEEEDSPGPAAAEPGGDPAYEGSGCGCKSEQNRAPFLGLLGLLILGRVRLGSSRRQKSHH